MPGLVCDLLRQRERLPIQLLEQVLLSMIRSLAVRVVGERFDDVRARVDEVAMEPQDALRVVEDHLRHECACLQVTTPLELEEIPLRADDRPFLQSLEQAELPVRRHRCLLPRHAFQSNDSILARWPSSLCSPSVART